MTRYETLFIAVPEITADETASLEKNFEKAINEHKASLISFERWGKYRLQYTIRTHEYGVYFLTRFEADKHVAHELLKSLRTLLGVKYNELVMRFMTNKIAPHSSLSYHRPESLEETPTRDVETFLKESKMTGLLATQEKNNSRREQASDDTIELDDMTETEEE